MTKRNPFGSSKLLFLCMYLCGTCAHTYMCRLEINTGCLPLLLFTFKTRSPKTQELTNFLDQLSHQLGSQPWEDSWYYAQPPTLGLYTHATIPRFWTKVWQLGSGPWRMQQTLTKLSPYPSFWLSELSFHSQWLKAYCLIHSRQGLYHWGTSYPLPEHLSVLSPLP